MRNVLRLCLIGVIVLSAAQWVCASELCVRVFDPASYALGGVTVTIVNLSGGYAPEQGITDHSGQGQTCFGRVREGHYRVEAWRQGFLHATFQPVVVRPRSTGKLTIHLPFGEIHEGGVHDSALLFGTLREKDGTGATVSSANICVFLSSDAQPLSCFETDELGEYRFSLNPGIYWIEVRKAGKRSDRVRLQLDAGEYRNAVRLRWRE